MVRDCHITLLDTKLTLPLAERGDQQLSAEEALSRLKKLNEDINSLLDDVGVFADWWQMTQASLQWIKANINYLRRSDNADILDRLRARWSSVGQKYIDYSREVRSPH